MNKQLHVFLLFIIATFTSSCGVNYAIIENQNQNSTQVHLSSNNYTILERVSGSSEVSYVLFIGGMDKSQLFANAYANMITAANLDSGPKAIINLVTEEHVGGVPPFYFVRTVTVSAHVIEFN